MAQTSALVVPKSSTTTTTSSSFPLYSKKANYDSSNTLSSRRSTIKNVFGIGSLTTLSSLLTIVAKPSPSQAAAEDGELTRGGVQLTPFNGLAFNYRGGDSQGLDGSTLDEPSVSYAYFLDALDKGNVEFVEFFAPSGDKAYVTFKAIEGVCTKCRPVRIGEGYPVEDPNGFSSPAFVIKTVQKKNVPYKFTLPALANYK
eukprot:CAMPEP_0198275602 /NCGR_PEP_ID=MMETSP1447-20131203/64864_1 /TAXON_ID=420782 /ORGANISM="Chaetoceros dichaeta, Strain CCMP1751" /LENGTH=199 /DNA_ID=CAMNT_0043970487 /DNA_START=175 /DNA_END=774 /DNA_ORIENTATION=+